ncbi:SlyX family protein [Thiospirochaeta perfilievii]|uniref:SlyX family protein n=1 Tax=Thiospirochaeta perfilievii TaxID=252967 RepID=A0A5C1QGN9_9SPIO|nr:SlyX family protein [Thiospirochaeta perfilievii]QEN05736.1 SlyX family protein [Thiospirochaeta perfilievii]
MDKKILDLEMKIIYLEDYMMQMNKIIIEQGIKLDKLIEVNSVLQEKIMILEENTKQPLDHTPPPHY